jgi:hypothetical protein
VSYSVLFCWNDVSTTLNYLQQTFVVAPEMLFLVYLTALSIAWGSFSQPARLNSRLDVA